MNIVAISVNKKFRDKLKKQFSDYKINFIEPIKLSDITARQYFNHIKNQKTNLLMSPGELACLLSHRRALDLCVKSNYAKTLIIEKILLAPMMISKKLKNYRV
jgi:GR25 family glycosyltransferase involved in LPS biosynthesis